MAMNTQFNRIFGISKCLGFLFVLACAWAISCSSSDEAPGGGHIAHPIEPYVNAGAVAASASRQKIDTPGPPSPAASASSMQAPLSESEDFEQRTGMKLSPRDKSIMDDCPERAWSQKVPKRACTKETECGDGFCDRGRCAPLWSCRQTYSRPCEQDAHCGPSYFCLEGRCQSCISDAECKWDMNNQNPRCTTTPWVPGARGCYGVVPSILGDTTPTPQSPKK